MICLSEAGQIVDVNESLATLLGYRNVDHLLLSVPHAADLFESPVLSSSLLKLTEQPTTPSFRRRIHGNITRIDGAVVPVRVFGRAITGPNGDVGVEAFVEDMSSWQIAHEALTETRTELTGLKAARQELQTIRGIHSSEIVVAVPRRKSA
jgi:PAS domain S-box-containing protein